MANTQLNEESTTNGMNNQTQQYPTKDEVDVIRKWCEKAKKVISIDFATQNQVSRLCSRIADVERGVGLLTVGALAYITINIARWALS